MSKKNRIIKCSQCRKKAIVSVGSSSPLCVDCFLKFQQAMDIKDRMIRERINFLVGQIEATSGIYGLSPKFPISQPVYHQGDITMNNIKIDKSTVGAVNIGEIGNLDVAITNIKQSGRKELAEALNKFTQALVDEREIKREKNQILEKLSFIISQINLPKESRKYSVIKAVFFSIKESVSTVSGLTDLWEKLYPLIKKAMEILNGG